MTYRVGVDIGGTFTDLCAFNEKTNELHTLKVLSTPERPGAEVMEGVRQLEARYGVAPSRIAYFTHGTTVGVNTVIQRKGVKLCLLVTENFVDVLEVARLKVPNPWDLLSTRPAPLIPRDRVLPVKERMSADGSVDAAVDEVSAIAAVEKARALGAEGIGAAHVAGLAGFPATMSLDIGGTSADVAFIRDGVPQYGVGEMIGEFPIFIPTVAVTSIGAGGGSIAWVDDLGVLKVGPESAGSTPGPACYGRGGMRPTITDAFALLGYLGSGELGYSAISVDVGKACAAIDTVA